MQNFDELTSCFNGLSSSKADEQLKNHGKNKIEEKPKISAFLRFLLQFGNIMILILIVAASLSIFLGILENSQSEIVDGCVIFAIVFFNAIFGFVQENKAIASIESLQKMSNPLAVVIRDGVTIKIPSENVVVGDLLIFEAGMVLCADIAITKCYSLLIDESALTGESVAREKLAIQSFEDINKFNSLPVGDRISGAFSGTTITNGRGEGIVIATGGRTQLGKIAHMLQDEKDEKTPLEKSIAHVGKIITTTVLIVAGLIFLAELILRPDLAIIDVFMTAVAISVAAIPESLPAVITIIMSMGVTKLAKNKAIVKKLHAVETLGCCEIICSDKTGTLTENIMTVQEIYTQNENELLFNMAMSNSCEVSDGKYLGDPTETALVEFAKLHNYDREALKKSGNKIINELPFDSVRKMMSVCVLKEASEIQLTKGGIDEILSKCTRYLNGNKVQKLTKAKILEIQNENERMASMGMRVLAFAQKTHNKQKSSNESIKTNSTTELPQNNLQQFETLNETDLIFVGITGMIDPPRKEALEAVKKCRSAGMKAIMITGDHKHTAFAIAKQVQIANDISEVLTGAEMDAMTQPQFMEILPKIKVFARVSPENKVMIVRAFKNLGKVVAMTGDGVNDAPAIKAANIGVGMGITGTDITKEAADIIISDDNFATIVLAVEEGRKIYTNIKKTIQFLFATNFAEITSLFLATIFFPEITFLLPLQILFVNLITDSLPAIALGVELPEKNLMKEKPREANKNLFTGAYAQTIIIQGLMQTFLLLTVFTLGLLFNAPEVTTTMTFFALNIIQIFHLLSVRTNGSIFKSNPFKNKMMAIALTVVTSIIILLAVTPIGSILSLVPLQFKNWLLVISVSILIVPMNELYRIIRNHRAKVKEKKGKNKN